MSNNINIGLCILYANAWSYFKIQINAPKNQWFVINTNHTEITVNWPFKMPPMTQENSINPIIEIFTKTFHSLQTSSIRHKKHVGDADWQMFTWSIQSFYIDLWAPNSQSDSGKWFIRYRIIVDIISSVILTLGTELNFRESRLHPKSRGKKIHLKR